MSKFLSYLRNDKGGAVEYVLVIAGIGGLVVLMTTNSTMRASFTGLLNGVISSAAKKNTF